MDIRQLSSNQKDVLIKIYATYGARYVRDELEFAVFTVPDNQSEIPQIFGDVISINFDKREFRIQITAETLHILDYIIELNKN